MAALAGALALGCKLRGVSLKSAIGQFLKTWDQLSDQAVEEIKRTFQCDYIGAPVTEDEKPKEWVN